MIAVVIQRTGLRLILHGILTVLLLLGVHAVHAQQISSLSQEEILSSPGTSGYSGTGSNIDVIYQRCEWRFHPDSPSALSPVKYLRGKVTTWFKTMSAGVNQISFDLNKTSFNNADLAISYHGSAVTYSFPSSGAVNIVTINLPVTLGAAVVDSIVINYAGAPPAVSGQAEGFQKGPSSASNNYYYTLSESYEDRDWWPCKADMQDKIDSMDFVISVPSAFWVAAPGVMLDSSLSGSDRIFRFAHRYPIPSYLVAIGVAKYQRYHRGTVNINGTEVPVVYNLFPGKTAANYTNILTALDKSKLELVAFSDLFGDYPYKLEKHGFYEFGWGGGMEHQSFSAMGTSVLTSWSVIAHELGHQWFGDKVSFATWNHLWLAEGFAKYMESLAAEFVPSLSQNPVTLRNSTKTTALSTSTTPVYLSNASIANSNTIWTTNNDNAVYQRGAMVVSMLRAIAGDSLFFLACRNYLSDPALAYRSATTEQLQAHFEAVLGGFDLTPFFSDYVYGTGNPVYTINWGTNSISKKLNIQVTSQSRSVGSTVAYFNAPIVLRVQGASPSTQDTTIVVYDNNGSVSLVGDGIVRTVSGNLISVILSFTPVTVSYDPFNQTLSTGSTQQLSSLQIRIKDFRVEEKERIPVLKLFLSESNTGGEILLERSVNGKPFQTLGRMRSDDPNGGNPVYYYADNDFNGPEAFYRALIIAADGEQTYSVVKRFIGRDQNDVSIGPNPFSDQLIISWNCTGILQEARIQIINQSGVLIKDTIMKNASVVIDTGSWPAGMYQVRILSGETCVMQRRMSLTR